MSTEFVAQTLNSTQLLALLYVCEGKRKNPMDASKYFEDPHSWQEFLDTFSSRLGNLEESSRFEMLEAHLMSVEDIDIYNNENLIQILQQNQNLMQNFVEKISRDERFATH